MSYILDALRRADSERERGAVPGIHAQPVPRVAADGDAPRRSRALLAASAGLVLVLLAWLGWHGLGREAAPDPAEAAQRAPAAPPLPLPVTPAEPVPMAAAPAPAIAPAPVAVVAAAPSLAGPRPPAPVARRPAATTTPALRPSVVARAAVGDPTASAGAASAAEPRVMLPSELPDEVRSGLPNLVVGGASYSQNPQSRMLIVNGQIFREGDKLSPEVSLEQIRLKEAVLSTKGYRYRIAY